MHNNKLERLMLRSQDALKIACFVGFVVRETAKSAWNERQKWHPNYIPGPKAIVKGTYASYDELCLWQKILGRL